MDRLRPHELLDKRYSPVISGKMKEMLELVEGRTDGFDSIEEQFRNFVLDSLNVNAKKMNELVNSTTEKLAERDENLKDMVSAMKKEIEELKGELTIYKAEFE
ncbi:hypothetical protein Golob_024386 [Gossypium lobatum]|uniref:Uncharacterized protein n=1 Tax=Gossypium lobatum TaxID=34289 RepID=A0A7J8NEN4_9ROSI|nr:hypothetical protein [Gossypium lobatum]